MSDPAKHIDQIEASVGTLDQTAGMREKLRALFVDLRSMLDIHSGLPTASPLRDGTEPEADQLAAEEAAELKVENEAIGDANALIDADNATIAASPENDQIDRDNQAVDKANAKVDATAKKAAAKK